MKTIYLAGGCFWGVEAYFNQLNGVLTTSAGYINGNEVIPTYEKVCSGVATHAEAIKVEYNEEVISLNKILTYFFRITDPYAVNKQGNDIGNQYRSGIYYDDESLKPLIINFIKNKFGKNYNKVKTEVVKNHGYYIAEDQHQKYLDKNVHGYCHVDLSDVEEEDLK